MSRYPQLRSDVGGRRGSLDLPNAACCKLWWLWGWAATLPGCSDVYHPGAYGQLGALAGRGYLLKQSVKQQNKHNCCASDGYFESWSYKFSNLSISYAMAISSKWNERRISRLYD